LDAGAKLQALMAGLAEGVVVQAADGSIIDCNPAAERILGLTRDQMAGRTSVDPRWSAIHEDGAPFPGELHPAMVTLRTGERQSGVIMGVRLPDGGDRWISITSEPIPDVAGGPPVAVVVTFTEITALRREQAAHAASRERYEWLAEHATDVIWTMDPATLRFAYVSRSIERLLGVTADEAMLMTLDDVMTPVSAARAREQWIGRLGQQGGLGPPEGEPSITGVFEQPGRDGGIRQVEITVNAVTDASGGLALIVGVCRDVTARVLAEQERERTLADLREALRTVKTLSGLLPICMYCKKIRTDEGYWDRIETYLANHTDALLSHSLCPDCYREHVPADLRDDDAAEEA
jgi:PAS domain S-box-containing protein